LNSASRSSRPRRFFFRRVDARLVFAQAGAQAANVPFATADKEWFRRHKVSDSRLLSSDRTGQGLAASGGWRMGAPLDFF